MKRLIVYLTFSLLCLTTSAQWTAFGTGMNGWVNAVCVYQGNLYATGQFTTSGGVTTNGIAYWNGTNWNACGAGLSGGGWFGNAQTGYALCVYGGNLIVGGIFATAGGVASQNIASWNGTTWSAFGTGGLHGAGTDNYYDQVTNLATVNGHLYLGGIYTCGDYTTEDFTEWTGAAWYWPGTPSGYYGNVQAMCVMGNSIYIGGQEYPGEPYFNTPGLGGYTYGSVITAWNDATSTFSISPSVGNSSGNQVFALCAWNGNIYAGGSFFTANGVTVNYIMKYSGGTFQTLSTGMGNQVVALYPFTSCSGNILIASGIFDSPSINNAQWNGASWNNIGILASNELNSMSLSYCSYGNYLVAGGEFTATLNGSTTLNYIGGLICGAILPVKLLDFTGEYNANNNCSDLKWSTATEVNNHYFFIQRSNDGQNWQTIDTVAGAGNSDETLYYTAVDHHPPVGVNYYRLEQQDFDGNIEPFNVVTINVLASKTVTIYPNPATSMVNIEGTDLQSVIIYNALGQSIWTGNAADSKIAVDVSYFANGIYIVQAIDKIGNTIMLRFVKEGNGSIK